MARSYSNLVEGFFRGGGGKGFLGSDFKLSANCMFDVIQTSKRLHA